VTTDDRNELERLRRQLEAVTAERDRLLAENRRLFHKFGLLRGYRAMGYETVPSPVCDPLMPDVP